MRTRVKICGITRQQDAITAVALGADAIGLVFYPPSSRYVGISQAVEIVEKLPPFTTVVGLFVNSDAETIAEVVNEVKIDLIQFHGDECPDYCAEHARPWIRAIRMKDDLNLNAAHQEFSQSRGLLLDAYRAGVPGGTGEIFDWSRIPSALGSSILLAGGLTADNVTEAVKQVRPYAVDVSGGVESSPGVKDAKQMARFIGAVRSADENK